MEEGRKKKGRRKEEGLKTKTLHVIPGPDRASLAGKCEAFLKAAEFISPDKHAEVEALVEELELEFIRAEKVP